MKNFLGEMKKRKMKQKKIKVKRKIYFLLLLNLQAFSVYYQAQSNGQIKVNEIVVKLVKLFTFVH